MGMFPKQELFLKLLGLILENLKKGKRCSFVYFSTWALMNLKTVSRKCELLGDTSKRPHHRVPSLVFRSKIAKKRMWKLGLLGISPIFKSLTLISIERNASKSI